jgi:hypothetical protein
MVRNEVGFGGVRLAYELTSANVPAVRAEFDGARIRVAIPAEVALRWTETDEVGIYSDSGSPSVAVEKEFRRTSSSSPDDADLYPNPRAPRH